MVVKIVIIGAGVGGTATAARLSKKGFQVEVYEKNSYNGGRCSTIRHEGHRFDQGPSLYLLPKLFEETFEDLGEDIKNHVDLLKCPSNYNVHFHDGKTFELTTDLAKLGRQLEEYEGDGESSLLDFLNYVKEAHVHYRRGVKIALKTDFQHWYDLFQLEFIPALVKLHVFDTVYNRVCKYFKSDYMRKAFTFQTMYLGMSPYEGLAPYSLLQYTELAEGIWYPRGGFHKVLESLENIAVKHGARFRYNSDVQEIVIDGRGRARGIRMRNGDEVEADVVVCNADLVYAYNRLLPRTSYAERLTRKTLTSSSISFYWSMRSVVPGLAAHNVFLAQRYAQSFDQIFRDHTLPDEPSFYVHAPTRVDPSAAPEGRDTVVVLMPVGHLLRHEDGQDAVAEDPVAEDGTSSWDLLVRRARQHAIRTLESRLGVKDLAAQIDHEIVNDPRTWTREFNLWKGSILGLSHSLFQVLWFRPSLKCKIFDRLYFVGASAQPGTGVPIVLCGAKLLEKQLCDRYLRDKTAVSSLQQSKYRVSFVVALLAILLFCFSLGLFE